MRIASTLGSLTLIAIFACSNGNTTSNTGSACAKTADCYPGIDASALKGTATCLTQIQGGYCTHTCSADGDCCAVSGECPKGFKEVCASFESTGMKYCFIGCDAADIAADPNPGTTDPNAFCQKWGGATFTCRSTGGGANNRKFCGP
jgi:hypothetical protein